MYFHLNFIKFFFFFFQELIKGNYYYYLNLLELMIIQFIEFIYENKIFLQDLNSFYLIF